MSRAPPLTAKTYVRLNDERFHVLACRRGTLAARSVDLVTSADV
jgi:hypothetical protein